MLSVPSILVPGEVCWIAIRNLIEQPEHATDAGKPRPAILLDRLQDGRWRVIGATTSSRYRDGTDRSRIPARLWEEKFAAIFRAGYLWSDRPAVVPSTDISTHLGWACPELRAFATRPMSSLTPASRNNFLRLRPDELAAS